MAERKRQEPRWAGSRRAAESGHGPPWQELSAAAPSPACAKDLLAARSAAGRLPTRSSAPSGPAQRTTGVDVKHPSWIAALDASIGRIVLKNPDFRFDHDHQGQGGGSRIFADAPGIGLRSPANELRSLNVRSSGIEEGKRGAPTCATT